MKQGRASWWMNSLVWLLVNSLQVAVLTQEAIAERLNTQKSAISRMENHAEDVKLSTLEKFAHSLGKRLEIRICG
jgi:transcriptional regulator with XRE-family HTH domain